MLIEVLGPSNMYVYRSKLLSAQIFCKRGDRQTLSFIEQARIALKEAFNNELPEKHPIFSELNKVTCDLLMQQQQYADLVSTASQLVPDEVL